MDVRFFFFWFVFVFIILIILMFFFFEGIVGEYFNVFEVEECEGGS